MYELKNDQNNKTFSFFNKLPTDLMKYKSSVIILLSTGNKTI
jgi:hypothetical protein